MSISSPVIRTGSVIVSSVTRRTSVTVALAFIAFWTATDGSKIRVRA